MRGKTKARVHTVFSKRVSELKTNAKEQAEAFKSGKGRPYTRPEVLADRDLQHVPSLHDNAFDRNDLNTNYDEVVQSAQDPGTVGDVAALKLQTAFNATEERAFRTRHASPLRCMAHMHVRLQGHGTDRGVLDRIESEVSNLIKAGGVT